MALVTKVEVDKIDINRFTSSLVAGEMVTASIRLITEFYDDADPNTILGHNHRRVPVVPTDASIANAGTLPNGAYLMNVLNAAMPTVIKNRYATYLSLIP